MPWTGLHSVDRRIGGIREEEQTGTLAAPEWLAYCRHRVAALVSPAWQARQYRCSCGYAADAVAAFDEHAKAADDMKPEHFEVLDGWDLEKVLAWRPAAGTATAQGSSIFSG